MLDEIHQKLKRLRRKMDRPPAARQLAGIDVEREVAEGVLPCHIKILRAFGTFSELGHDLSACGANLVNHRKEVLWEIRKWQSLFWRFPRRLLAPRHLRLMTTVRSAPVHWRRFKRRATRRRP